jgi:hypothetical protein
MDNWPIQDRRPFEIAFLRIERANQHRLAAANVWSDFLDEEPYHPVVRVDDDGAGELWIGLEAERLPLDIGFELGEMLYQYRAALDSSIYDANVIETGQNPPPDERALEFPICDSESIFTGSRRKLGQLPREYVEFIEAIQPYNAPQIADDLRPKNINRNLLMLNDWSRKDRHRFLHIARSWGANRAPLLKLPDGVQVERMEIIPDAILEHDSRVAVFKLAGWHRGMHVEANPNLTIDAAIDEPPPPINDNDTLGHRAYNIAFSVHLVVGKVEDIAKRARG